MMLLICYLRHSQGLVLFGLTAFAFGVSFCHLALHLYGGELLSAGVGPVLLRAHCAYIIFLAVNGVTECYAFAAMTGEQVRRAPSWKIHF